MSAWSGVVVLDTARLRLRTFRRDDLPYYAALNADPEVTRHLGGPLDRRESDEIAEWAQQVHAEEGIGLLAVERRSDGAFIGMCGLHHLHWYPDDVELGFRLARAYWGQGYATEACHAWLVHGLDTLVLPRVISVTDAVNQRSIALLDRLGMRFDHSAQLEDSGVTFTASVYAVTADDWARWPSQRTR